MLLISRRQAFIALATLLATPQSLYAVPLHTSEHHIALGDSTVTLRVTEGGIGPTFVRVHHNETDAGTIGIRAVTELGGRFVDLIHSGGRNVVFKSGKNIYAFDPNRIFTEPGMALTLRSLHHGRGAPEAMTELRKLASAILDLTGRTGSVIALHNNSGASFGLSAYQHGGMYYRGDQKTFAYLGTDGPQNVVVVTRRELFDEFVHRKLTVAYQLPRSDKDDGSMSYWFGSNDLPYINIDTRIDNAGVQWDIVRIAHSLFTKPATVGLRIQK